jgi:aspartyl protease family protein
MSDFDVGRLAYLVLLGLAVGGYFLAQGRENLGRTAQQAVVWGLIFVGMIAGFGLWGDIRNDVAPRQSIISDTMIEIPRSADGHYYAVLELNGQAVRFVIDTGATDVVLTKSDAARVGLELNALAYSGSATTANGVVRTAPARIAEFQFGAITDRDIRVFVNQGKMAESLLGMSYLQRFGKIEIARDRLLLTR